MDLMFILFWFFPDRAMDGHRWCDVLSGSQAKPYRESESRDFRALRQKQAVRNRDFSEGELSPDGSIRRLTMLVIASGCFSGGKIRGIRVSRRKMQQ
jgi:hypothetical protein